MEPSDEPDEPDESEADVSMSNRNILDDYLIIPDHDKVENVQQLDEKKRHIEMEFYDELKTEAGQYYQGWVS